MRAHSTFAASRGSTMRSAIRACPSPSTGRSMLQVRNAQGDLATVTITKSSPARQLLSEAIREAVKKEDYVAAANLQKELEIMNLDDPIFAVTERLSSAVKEENYTLAAELQKELDELKEAEKLAEEEAKPKKVSQNVTRGVRVDVRSTYKRIQSTRQVMGKNSFHVPRTQAGKYFFNYHVVITNQGEQIVQLKSRHWVIVDKDGYTEEVSGPGVVGSQPILRPGESFEYSSYCPLTTTQGTMEGEYEIMVLTDQGDDSEDIFEAKIGPLLLSTE